MKAELNEAVKSMSSKKMENSIFDILIDNGMHPIKADETVRSMSTQDMEKYLSDALNNIEDEENES